MPLLPEHITKLLYDTLAHFWGYQEFREPQEEIISSIIMGQDTFALLPTGGGKSLCYQLPALVLEGTCIVVSPLLALMKDQVYQLKSKGIEAEYLSSELDEAQAEQIYSLCIEGTTKILFVSPERLTNSLFLQKIEEIKVSFLAVDEAHCISEWGQDFRPSYQNIHKFRKDRLKDLPVLALTATATPKVLEDIKSKLNLKTPQIFQKSFERTNIKIHTEECSDKYSRILNLVKNHPYSGIIYASTRKETQQLTEFLQHNGIPNVDFYHAGLPLKEKHQKQNQWLHSNNGVLVATNAFGMGINKDDVRYVIHLSPPSSVENYYQEIGRGGRDGEPALAYLLWNKYELSNSDETLKQQIPNKESFKKAISYLYSLFQIADFELPEQTFQFNIRQWQRVTKIPLASLKNILSFLHNQEIIYCNNLKSKSSIELNIEVEGFESLAPQDAYFIEVLLRHLSGFSHHKVSFREEHLAHKINTNPTELKKRLLELANKGYINYIDGALASIKFLIPRDNASFGGKWWHLFLEIQKNKVQKWEEMKFFIQSEKYCKMKMILSYFGEKKAQNCGQCSVCLSRKTSLSSAHNPILKVLAVEPCTLEDLSAQIPHLSREKLLEQVILLLDTDKIKMLNYKTYTINS
ncbi:ATP-dependent DNA helicase RecQ [Riemerella anatipestifer]|uniref:RecQ family ATP-dependent DNA helicase n=1 Tax=Riemerella anatipestifer TaxID=34085 RepID=UPI002EC1E549|nr:ATP-dependent DNA helicase RecQ [Riemerella anatipestifer]